MPLEQHRHFNKILNDMVNKTQAREYRVNIKAVPQLDIDIHIMCRESVSSINTQTKQTNSTRYQTADKSFE